MPLVTIVIRAKDEEFWIGQALAQIAKQRFQDYEVVLVDSGSTDNTRWIFQSAMPKGTIIDLAEPYLPGRAINEGIEAGTGKFAVIVSAHCVPVHEDWLGFLVKSMEPEDVGAAYGRQLPLPSSHPWDTRDLLNMFGVERRVQRRDTFLHNANSIIRRSLWEEVPFDADTPHIEDRIWAEQMVRRGWAIVYEPDASVYHYHGVNHRDDLPRASAISDILTERTMEHQAIMPPFMQPENQPTMYCFLGHDRSTATRLGILLKEVKMCCPPGRVFVHSADPKAVNEEDATVVPRTPDDEERTFVEILETMLGAAAALHCYPNCLVYMNLRLGALQLERVGRLVELFYKGTYDSVFIAHKEYSNVWMPHEGTYRQMAANFSPHSRKEPLYISEYGLGVATRPEFIRSGQLVGAKVGIVEV